jgi:hypothetical protein
MSTSQELSRRHEVSPELSPACAGVPRPARHSRGPGRHVPVFPEAKLVVRPWPDPVLDTMGHDPRSAYAEQYWLSIVGPSSLLLLRRLANRLEVEPEGFEIDPVLWAAELGLGAKGGQHGPFWRSIDRACRFGAAQRAGQLLYVRRRLPPLTSRQINRLPDHLRQAHAQWQALQLERPRRKTITHWSDHGQPPTLDW